MKNAYQKKYDNVSLAGDESPNGKWAEWDGQSGTDVQEFIKDKLEDAIVDFEYAGTTLNGYNAFGQIVASTPVIVTDPTFRFEENSLVINEFRINGDLINMSKYTGNANSNLTASLNFTYNLIQEIGGEAKQNSTTAVTYEISLVEENGNPIPQISPITGKCNWSASGINVNSESLKNLLLLRTNKTSKLQIRLFIDYTVTVGDSKTVETAEIITNASEMTVLNLRRLCLTYSGSSLIKTNSITLGGDKVEGTGIEDVNNYTIQYALNSEDTRTTLVTNAASPQISLAEVITSDIKVTPVNLCVRVINNDGTLSSDWLSLNLLYQKADWVENSGATAIISNIPTEITNCDAPALFQIMTTDKLSGNVKIYAYKSNNLGAIQNISVDPTNPYYYKNEQISEYLFKEATLSLNTAEDHDPDLKYYSYIELDPDSLGSSSTIYLTFIIEPEIGEAYRQIFYRGDGMAVNGYDYSAIKIVTNKYNKELLYTSGAIIDYSQISSTNTFNQDGKQVQLFEASNLSDKIDSADGQVQDGKYVGFKVSPLGKTNGVPENLFKKPIHLMDSNGNDLLSTDKFSIEFNLKTYNVNDDNDLIAKIGNIYIYPHYLRVYEPSEGISASTGRRDLASVYEASCANFSKDEITNIIITYDANYKASTYNVLYDDLYQGDTTKFSQNAPTYPCLKIYINGTINRSVSVNKAKLGESYFNIHPSSTNVNIYGFRTYAHCLSYEEIQKNKISSLNSFEEKEAYYINNDILFNQDDFSSSDWAKVSDKAGTICFEKVLGTFKGVRDRHYNPKNVILIVTDDRGPMMFANTNGKDSNNKKLKIKDATLFVKYADASKKVLRDANGTIIGGNGKLIGQRLTSHFAYDEYYKAQGSSAKRYGGAYNVQYAKFWYIPEDYINEVSKNLKYVEKTAEGLVLNDEVYKPAASSEEGYTYTVYSKAHPEGEEKVSKTADNKDTKTLWKNVIDKAVSRTANKAYLSEESELPGQDIAKDFGITDYDGKNVVRMAKSVGKVNYASSMQSHKPGGTDLFAECYPDRANDYCKRRAVHEDPFYYFFIKLSDCKNKADGSRPTFWTVTWDDIDPLKVSFFGFLTWGSAKMDKPTFGNGGDDDLEYLCIEGADNKNQCTNFKTPWAAQQMWRDDANQQDLPFYAEAQKKAPGSYVNQHSGKNSDGTPNYTDGLLFYDETIMFRTTSQQEDDAGKDAINKNAESWDVAGNALTETENPAGGEFDTSFTWNSEAAKISFSRFAEWFNSIYAFDFGNLEVLPQLENAKGISTDPILINNDISNPSLDSQKKYIIPIDWYYKNINSISKSEDYSDSSVIQGKAGSVLRYDPIFNKWVPAGLYYDVINTTWEDFNIIDLYHAARKVVVGEDPATEMRSGQYSQWIKYIQNIVNKALSNSGKDKSEFFVKVGQDYPLFGTKFTQYEVLNNLTNRDAYLTRIKLCLSELFKAAIWAYCDVDSFAYHQAAIRFLSGTDNRAKNQYFLIKGRKYSGGLPLAEDDENQYKFKNRDLITLFQDDVDTIFATDNNGQQAKPYNLMEPAYNLSTIGDWGDSRSGLWYNFDMVFKEEIKDHLQRIITWATGGGQIIDKTNPLYTRFLKMQDVDFAQIAYNHTSEIYYDAMQSVYNSSLSENGSLTDFGNSIPGFAKNNFNNNQVPNPESLVHGSCIESERQFLKKRVALLASYSGSSYKTEFNGLDKIGVKGDSASGLGSAPKIAMSNLAYIQDYYPKFVSTSLQSFEKTGHDPIIDALSRLGPTSTFYYNPDTYVYNKVDENNTAINYSVSVTLSTTLTSAEEIQYTSYIKEITFTEGMHQIVSMKLPNASVVACEIPEDMSPKKGISFNGGQTETVLYMDNIIPNVEVLRAPYSIFNIDKIDFSNCTRLKELDLSEAKYSDMYPISQILLPKSSKLTKVMLPSSLKDITIEYYPGIKTLEDFTFDSEVVALDSISLDMRNFWAFDFLDKYAESSKKIILNNLPSSVTMSAALLQKLAELAIKGNFTFGNNSITINLEVGSRMDITLKSLLAEAFGDIDSSADSQKVKVNYQIFPAVSISTIDEEIQITKTGVTENPFGAKLIAADGEEANNIKIKNGKLAFTYNIANNKSGVSLESTTSGNVVVSTSTNINNTDDINVTISAELLSGTVPNKVVALKFGDYIPQLGDIAYADGTFGSKYNGKEAIGFVYWSNLIDEDLVEGTRTFDIRVMSNDSYDEKFGPSSLGTGYTGNTYIKSAYSNVIEQLVKDFKDDLINLSSISGTELEEDQKHYSTSDAPVDGLLVGITKTNLSVIQDSAITPSFDFKLLPTVSDKTSTIKPKSNLYCNKYITEAISQEVISKYNILKQNVKFKNNLNGTTLNKDQFDTIKSRLVVTDSNGDTYPADWLIYPAFTKTYLYAPNIEDSKLSEEYKEHNWYVPSSIELAWIIQQKIIMMHNPTQSNPEDLWNASSDQFYLGTALKTYNTKNIFYKLLSAYNATTYAAFQNNSKVKNIGIFNISPITENISQYDSDKFIIKSGTFVNFNENSQMGSRDFLSTIVYTKTATSSPKTCWTNSSFYTSGSSYVPNIAKGRIYPCCRVIKTVKI